MLARHVAAAAIAAALVSGCYSPSFRECAVACGANGECPGGSTCGADGFCHGARASQDCRELPGGDAGTSDPDAPLPEMCAAPMLLVSIENLSGSGGGRLARFSIDGQGFSRCADLPLASPQPLALAFVPPNRVAVAGREAVTLLDAETGETVWSSPFDADVVPRDALVVEEGALLRLAVGLDDPQSIDDIDPIELFDLDSGDPVGTFRPGLSTRGVARNPRAPGFLLRLRPGSFAAAEVDPFSGEILDDPPYVRDRSDSTLRTIAASFDRPPRIAWTGVRLSDDRDGVFYLSDPDTGASDQVALGPVRCDDAERSYLQAIPDTVVATRFFTVAEQGQVRQVLRFSSTGGACDLLLDGASLGPSTRIADLALIE